MIDKDTENFLKKIIDNFDSKDKHYEIKENLFIVDLYGVKMEEIETLIHEISKKNLTFLIVPDGIKIHIVIHKKAEFIK